MNENELKEKMRSFLPQLDLSGKGKTNTSKVLNIAARMILGIVFFIVGFNFSYSAFFRDNPLFGVRFLAEILISLVTALFGFHTVPLLIFKVRTWFEEVVASTVYRVVSDFWDQQNKKMQESRKQRDKERKSKRDKKLKEKLLKGILLDTSVIIDGRVLDIVKTGFVDKTLVVPQSVVDELHLLSDNDNTLKRQRGRRGLDMVGSLKKETKVVIFKNKSGSNAVDKELIKLAKKCGMYLMTLDFNLNKVAKIAGVKVLNINELVNAVKASVLPGESMKVKIVQEGKEKQQGVGYLPDGTMIVVQNARYLVGEEIDVVVSRVIQTQAGKMIFCELGR